MRDDSAQERFPLQGIGRGFKAGAAIMGMITIALAVSTLMPPPRPAAAAPRFVAAASPSPDSAPSAAPEKASATPGASPSETTAPTTSTPQAESQDKKIEIITQKMEHLNPSLKDWTSEVDIDAKVKLLMLLMPMTLHGRSYHKAPDKYKFELENAPALLQRYQQVFGYRPVNLADFVATMLPDETVNGRPNYVVRLDKKATNTDFRSQTVWIDKENFTSPRRLYLYKDNGKIDVAFNWRKESGYIVIDTMDASLEFPKLNGSAKVKATYVTYHFNTGLDDHIFDEKKPTTAGTAH